MDSTEKMKVVKAASETCETSRRMARIREIHAINQMAKIAKETDRAASRAAYRQKAEKLDLAHQDELVRFASVVLEASDQHRWHLPFRELTPRLRRELINQLTRLDKLVSSKSELDPATPAQQKSAGEPITFTPTKPPKSQLS